MVIKYAITLSKKMGNKKKLDEEHGEFEVSISKGSNVIKFRNNLFEIKNLDWDSKILGLNFYKINKIGLDSEEDYDIVKKIINFIKLKFEGIDCMTYKTEATKIGLIQNLQKNGFVLAGLPVRLSINLENIKDYEDQNIRLFENKDAGILSEIARNTFLNAYRYNDKKFDKSRVDDLYSEWIKNSCKGRAEAVFVYEDDNVPMGFIACNIKDKTGLIDLIAVSKDARGKGIGKKLVLNSLSWFKDKVDKVEVNTEAMNYPSLRIYQNAGFKIEWIGADLDYWFR